METIDDIGGKPLILREEQAGDHAAIAAVITAAFGQPGEAALVEALRAAGALTLSLVAVADGEVVGHVAFSPVTIDGRDAAIGLAPMAVAPGWQRRGVGVRLIDEALDRLRADGHRAVVVLGHHDYYPRFGFVPASRFGLRCEYDAPDEAFMALELVPGALAGVSGLVRYRPEFAAVG
jgi:putative acetyltransferase